MKTTTVQNVVAEEHTLLWGKREDRWKENGASKDMN
jgi:hypothetical protein